MKLLTRWYGCGIPQSIKANSLIVVHNDVFAITPQGNVSDAGMSDGTLAERIMTGALTKKSPSVTGSEKLWLF